MMFTVGITLPRRCQLGACKPRKPDGVYLRMAEGELKSKKLMERISKRGIALPARFPASEGLPHIRAAEFTRQTAHFFSGGPHFAAQFLAVPIRSGRTDAAVNVAPNSHRFPAGIRRLAPRLSPG